MNSPVDLRDIHRAILYCYPGADWTPEGGYDSRALDETQHRAFAECWQDLLALGCNAFGVSTQDESEQRLTAEKLGIGQPLLCDINHTLERELRLPTFGMEGNRWYCRLILIIDEGTIAHVLYPVASAATSPAQAIAWMRRQRWA